MKVPGALVVAALLLSFHVAAATDRDIDDDVPPPSNPSESKTSSYLQLSAVVNEPVFPYHAIVECWELSDPFVEYPTVGSALDLGDVANATYVVLPARSEEGWHRPPHPMFFVQLTGVAHVKTFARTTRSRDRDQSPIRSDSFESPSQSALVASRPEPTESLYVSAGIQPLIIAADTDPRSPGHLTFYPGDVEAVAIQIPFRDGLPPDHTVVHDGPCRVDHEKDTEQM